MNIFKTTLVLAVLLLFQACQQAPEMGKDTVELTSENFEQIAIKSKKVVMIDFWAVWCGPCRAVAPIVKELAEEYAGKVIVGKIDVDKQQQLAMKFGIQNIPTMLFFKDGQLVDKQIGLVPKEMLKAKLDALLAK